MLEFCRISQTLSFHDLSQLPRVYFLKAGNNGDMNEFHSTLILPVSLKVVFQIKWNIIVWAS